MSMAELVFSPDKVEGLGFTIYADDVTFWAAGTVLAAQQATLQCALDVNVQFLEDTSVAQFPVKTNYLIVARRRGDLRTSATN